MEMTNNIGPSTLPCGIPVVTFRDDDVFPFTETICDLFFKKVFCPIDDFIAYSVPLQLTD
jgi:hypothetical protein